MNAAEGRAGGRDTFAGPDGVVHLESVSTLADVGAWPVDAVHQRAGALVTALQAFVHVCTQHATIVSTTTSDL